jgi:hypothetical protein
MINFNVPQDAVPQRAGVPQEGVSFGEIQSSPFSDQINSTIPFNGTTQDMAYYFELQVQVARETLFFQTISNIIKARQDASLNSVRNMRS